MILFRSSIFAVAAVCAVALSGPSPATAQGLSANDQPAEFPPDSYTGRQYVDSEGCVFVRAGFDGAVTWVPRVSRSRTKLCGFTPTNVRRPEPPVIADAPGTPPPGAEAPVRAATPAPRQVAAAPRVVTQPRVAAEQPRVAAPRVVQQQPAPPSVRVAAVAPPPSAAPQPQRVVRSTCPGASPVSAQYINPGARCGPQAVHPGGTAVQGRAGQGGPVQGAANGTTVLRFVTNPPLTVPKGYRKAWEDDRLNPNRGKQTLSGALQTALVWTQTVPRRLVDANGVDRTREYNYLLYPYTDYAKQKRDLAGGQHITVRTAAGQRMIVHKSQLGVSAQTGKTVLRHSGASNVSTKSVRAPAAAPTAASVAGRYVQVGTFGNPSNASATVARLQGAGLPMRVGQVNRGGRTLQVVVAGPFASAEQVQNGLNVARRAGFSDAFVRK